MSNLPDEDKPGPSTPNMKTESFSPCTMGSIFPRLDDLLVPYPSPLPLPGVPTSPVKTSVKRKRTKKETPNEEWNRNNVKLHSRLGIVPYYRQSDPEDDLPPSYFKRAPPDSDFEDAHTPMFSTRLMTDVDRKRKAYDEKDEGGRRKLIKNTKGKRKKKAIVIDTNSDTNSDIDSEIDWSSVHTNKWAQSLQKATRELAQDMKDAKSVWEECGARFRDAERRLGNLQSIIRDPSGGY